LRLSKRPHGSGGLKLRGRIWYIDYRTASGKRVFESSKSEKREVAQALLQRRLGQVVSGEEVLIKKTTVSELCDLVIADHEVRQLRDTETVKWRYGAHVKPAVGSLLAVRFGTRQANSYATMRREKDEASNATINRELSIIRRGFNLGYRQDPPLVTKVPYIPKLEEDNARQGFLSDDQYDVLLHALPDRLKALFVVACHVGTRKGEIRRLEWDQVDFEERVIRLAGSQTKGKKARGLPIFGDMEEWLRWQRERCPEGYRYVFFSKRYSYPVGGHLSGWREACIKAGVPGLLFHDLRRTAVRTMRRAGIDQRLRMLVSGHETPSMERRYDIVDDTDLNIVRTKMDEYRKSRKSVKPAELKRVK
jgi:integrase